MASFRLFISKILYNCSRESILSNKEGGLNGELEIENQILDEANQKLWIALQKKDVAAVSVAQAMIEPVHKKKVLTQIWF